MKRAQSGSILIHTRIKMTIVNHLIVGSIACLSVRGSGKPTQCVAEPSHLASRQNPEDKSQDRPPFQFEALVGSFPEGTKPAESSARGRDDPPVAQGAGEIVRSALGKGDL